MKYRYGNVICVLVTLALLLFTIPAHAVEVGTLDKLKEAVNNGGDIKLIADIKTNDMFYVTKDTSIDLNGYGILMEANKGIINITAQDATLTLYDSRPDSTHYFTLNEYGQATGIADTKSDETLEVTGGYIAGGYGFGSGGVIVQGGAFIMNSGSIFGNAATGGGGGVCVGSGTFTMNGGAIFGNIGLAGGGGVCVQGGTFNMNDGAITGNNGNMGGGVILAAGTFTMISGSITGNNANPLTVYDLPGDGGGMYIIGGTFEMTGGTISGNNAAGSGGGVIFMSGDMSLSGSPVITGNFAGDSLSNVYLSNDVLFTFPDDGSLAESAEIGVIMDAPRVFTKGLAGKGIITNFTTDDYNYAIIEDNGEAALTAHSHKLTYAMSGDSTITVTCSEKNCSLPDGKASITIGMPDSDDGKATLTCSPSSFFDVSALAASVKYQTRNTSGTWGDKTDTPSTANGFHMASVEYQGLTASITYGINCISYINQENSHGTISGSVTAAVGVVITPKISCDTGYEIETLSAVRDDGNGDVTVIGNKSFIMPDSFVTVSASFKIIDYEISCKITSGSVTIPETANYGDKVRFVVSPDEGCGIYAITVPSVSIDLISWDIDSGVEIYELNMPQSDISINIEMAERIIYTIFYKADDNTQAISYRFAGSYETGFSMRSDAKAGDVSCWAGQMWGVEGKSSFTVAFNADKGGWVSQDCAVVEDITKINTMNEGEAILVPGDENAFIAIFSWGAYLLDETGYIIGLREDLGTKYYFVTKNTESISVPNPTQTGYDFAGWSYRSGRYSSSNTINAGSSSTQVNIKDTIESTTTFMAIWRRATPTVIYDLDGGSWSRSNSETVTYGATITKPTETPTKNGYAFDRWIVKTDVEALKGDSIVMLTARNNFDFDTTKIIGNIRLKAAWKHVHNYVRIPLSKLNSIIPGAVSQAHIDAYGEYIHFRLCTRLDDYDFEGHSFGKDGKCACGAVKPVPDVALEITYNDREHTNPIKYTAKLNSQVSIMAPEIETDKFVKWEYRSVNGTEWKDLSSRPTISFLLPGSVRINAVYEKLAEPQLKLRAERFNNNGMLFFMEYALPSDCEAKNACIILGDNITLGYRYIVRHLIPPKVDIWGSLKNMFSVTTKAIGTITSLTDKILNKTMDFMGIENKLLRNSISLGASLLTGDVAGSVTTLAGQVLEATGLDDTIVGDIANLGMALATADEDSVMDLVSSGMTLVENATGASGSSNSDPRYEYKYYGREDSLLVPASYKNDLMWIMLRGICVTLGGYNEAIYQKAEDLGRLTGTAYTGYTNVKDINNGDHFFYVVGWVEYKTPDNKRKIAVVGPTAFTYNGTQTPVTYTEEKANIIQ